MSELNNNTSGSLYPAVTSSLNNWEVVGEERIINRIYRDVEEIKQKLFEIESKKILDETQFPAELLEQNGLLPKRPIRLKRGYGYRPLLQSEIEAAKKATPFCAAQARWLGVAESTYKKYSKMYGLWEPHPNVKGKRNIFSPDKGKYPLTKILNGDYYDHPRVNDWLVKDKLIRSGMVPIRCAICGYDKRRIADRKMCILLDHKDGDRRNFKFNNLQLLCFNCTFECGRGYIRNGTHMFDVDWLQGAELDEIDPTSRW